MTEPIPLENSRIRLRDGVEFTIVTDPRQGDPISSQLRQGIFPLSRLYGILRACVPGTGRVLDLGGHVGSFALAAAAAGYQVLCVEASPENADLIGKSVAANGHTNIAVERLAISNKPGVLRFYARGPYGHLAPDGAPGEISVDAVTVDGLLASRGWDHVDFIKLDIEGSEVAALDGMRGLLGRPNPPFLFCESNAHMLDVFGKTPQVLRTALSELGMRMFEVHETGIRAIDVDDIQTSTVVDLLASKQSLPARLASEIEPGAAARAGDIVSRLWATARSDLAEERRFVARTLRDSASCFTGERRAEELRQLLARDKDELVTAIAKAAGPFHRGRRRWFSLS